MKFLKRFRAKRSFPKTIKNVWFAGLDAWADRQPRKYLVPYRCYSIGDVVPMLEKEGYVAYYTIVHWKIHGHDLAGWDDGRHYDLELKEVKEE